MNNYTNKYINGRIDILDYNKEEYNLYETGEKKCDFGNSTKSIINETPIGKLFFSRKNIEFLHQMIIKNVYNQSNKQFKIAKQNELQLEIIMRSIYLQESKFLNCKLTDQLSELNKKVINTCTKNILVEIKQYLGYKKDVSINPTPLEHPKNLSKKGSKILTPNIGFN